MKRRKFLVILSTIYSLILISCEDKKPSPPTIFTGYVIDENNQPAEGVGFLFLSDKKGFLRKTESDSKGYFYLEAIVPDGAGLVDFQVTDGNGKYPDGLYIRLCLVKGVYQKIIPWSLDKKNELNFKVVKR